MSMKLVPLERIFESKTNPHARGGDLAELAESVSQHGVLQPVLLRPMNGAWEIVAGHRRCAAARIAGLTEVPATIRELNDAEAHEIQLIENLQRADLHPLEEAKGYAQLLKSNYDTARIARRVGRSVAYVYDRLKLLALTKAAQKLFREDRFTTAHAVLIARLSPDDQARVLDPETPAPLFQDESTLFDPEAPETDDEKRNPYDGMKVRSVRELQAWIDGNVRFDPEARDIPQLFPETAVVLEGADKVVAITHSHYVPEEARDGKTIGPRSWKRADGKNGSKACDAAVTGFVAIGPGRGSAFPVCIAKDTCVVHWKERIADRRKAAKAKATKPATVTKPSAKSAPAPQQVDQKLLNAIHKAIGTAREEAEVKLRTLACEAAPEAFLRAYVMSLDTFQVMSYGRKTGDKAALAVNSYAKLDKWASAASLSALQGVCYENVLEYGDQALFAIAFDVDFSAIERDIEKRVRAEWAAKVKTADPAPAKPAKAKKRGAK